MVDLVLNTIWLPKFSRHDNLVLLTYNKTNVTITCCNIHLWDCPNREGIHTGFRGPTGNQGHRAEQGQGDNCHHNRYFSHKYFLSVIVYQPESPDSILMVIINYRLLYVNRCKEFCGVKNEPF
ncbi:hypothetical protein ACFLVO_02255 [Chloroflexota bacterium]